MKVSFLLFLFLLSLPVFSRSDIIGVTRVNEVVNKSTNAPDGSCHDCRTSSNNGGHPLPTEHRKDGVYFNEKCTNFIKSDGTEGAWGELVTNYIDEAGGPDSLFLDDEVRGMTAAPGTCPNWYNLNTEQRKRFWVWMMASIAQVESSCDKDKVNTGRVPNGADRPRGLFQLNTLKKNRSWRGGNCKFPSGATHTNQPRNQVRCSMDIMHELLKGKSGEYKSNGKIFPTNSYWEKLRPGHSSTGGPIGKLVRKFPLCGH
ncbi:hypothetical protein [Halobacteriovorax sp. JY17]|uniref:hypothetical protein n=1 Tax=Halobacteriovorax sp. JY17 TaxID=2014617 RepID=UPI000C4DD7E0|nr:hypothetical protein [Halobacteriovorax sp. JY17]PIK14199.1 MAG: hypothetical protein CES88_14560 [Halobacteriovorax sp. JY17]